MLLWSLSLTAIKLLQNLSISHILSQLWSALFMVRDVTTIKLCIVFWENERSNCHGQPRLECECVGSSRHRVIQLSWSVMCRTGPIYVTSLQSWWLRRESLRCRTPASPCFLISQSGTLILFLGWGRLAFFFFPFSSEVILARGPCSITPSDPGPVQEDLQKTLGQDINEKLHEGRALIQLVVSSVEELVRDGGPAG